MKTEDAYRRITNSIDAKLKMCPTAQMGLCDAMCASCIVRVCKNCGQVEGSHSCEKGFEPYV